MSDGEIVWQQRLSQLGNAWATPVVANDKIYLFDQTGVGRIVVDRGEMAEVIAEPDLQEGVLGSPAISQGRLIVRGVQNLFCFE